MFPLPAREHVIGLAHVLAVLRQDWLGHFLIPHVKPLLGLRPELHRAAQAGALRAKLEAAARHDRGVVGELASGGEVFVELLRADEEHVADVGKAFAAAVGRKILRELDIDAGEVAEGAVVFGVGQAAHRDRAGIAGIGAHRGFERMLQPLQHLAFFRVSERRFVVRRHVARGDGLLHLRPALALPSELRIAVELLQVHAALGLPTAVAVVALLLQRRAHVFPNRRRAYTGGARQL